VLCQEATVKRPDPLTPRRHADGALDIDFHRRRAALLRQAARQAALLRLRCLLSRKRA
jgi:hypothetical protein